ncbi:MAG: DsbA family protein [Chitinophagaceae bacterium]
MLFKRKTITIHRLNSPVQHDDHLQAYPESTIELVEYGDYQNPYCVHANSMVKMLQQNFGKNLRFAFRHFPMSTVNDFALPAALAAEAAHRQDKFWEMHDLIFDKQDYLNEYALIEFAMQLRLRLTTFKKDLLDPALAKKVKADFDSGISSGVKDAPTFFINGEKYTGDLDYVSLAEAMIERHNII